MNKIRKIGLYSLSLVLGISILIGCSSNLPSAKSILKDAASAFKDVESLDANIKMDLDLAMKSKDEKDNIQISASMDMDSTILLKTQESHTTTTTKVSALGQKQDETVEQYIVEEDGKKFSYSSSDDTWSKDIHTEAESSTSLNQDWEELIKLLDGDNSLYKGIDVTGEGKVDGKKTYIVTFTISGKDIESTLDALPKDEQIDSYKEMFKDINFSKMELEYTIEFYQESKLPARIHFDLKDFIQEFGKGLINDLGESMGMGSLELKFETASMEAEFTKYNETKEIKVPESVKTSAIEFMENDQGPVSGPWDSFKFHLSEKEFTIGDPFSAFQEIGVTFEDEDDSKLTIEGKQVESIPMKKGESTLSLSFYNPSEEVKPIAECVIIEIFVDEDGAALGFVLPENITIGSTMDELLSIYPNFSSKNAYSTETSFTYMKDDAHSLYINVDKKTGKITSISLYATPADAEY